MLGTRRCETSARGLLDHLAKRATQARVGVAQVHRKIGGGEKEVQFFFALSVSAAAGAGRCPAAAALLQCTPIASANRADRALSNALLFVCRSFLVEELPQQRCRRRWCSFSLRYLFLPLPAPATASPLLLCYSTRR